MQEICLGEIGEDYIALKRISPLYAGRGGLLTAVLQYVYQTVRNREKLFEVLAGEALYDFELLGALIEKLGADPVFTACPPYPVSYHSAAGVDYAKSLHAMLAADIRMEERLLAGYHAALSALQEGPAAGAVVRLRDNCASRLARLRSAQEACI